MCDAAVRKDPFSLQDVPDWFVTQRQIKTWRDDDDYGNYDDGVITWYDSYKKRTAQKAQIKEKLLPLAWQPTRMRNWWMEEDEKKGLQKCLLRKVRVDSCFWLSDMSTKKII